MIQYTQRYTLFHRYVQEPSHKNRISTKSSQKCWSLVREGAGAWGAELRRRGALLRQLPRPCSWGETSVRGDGVRRRCGLSSVFWQDALPGGTGLTGRGHAPSSPVYIMIAHLLLCRKSPSMAGDHVALRDQNTVVTVVLLATEQLRGLKAEVRWKATEPLATTARRGSAGALPDWEVQLCPGSQGDSVAMVSSRGFLTLPFWGGVGHHFPSGASRETSAWLGARSFCVGSGGQVRSAQQGPLVIGLLSRGLGRFLGHWFLPESLKMLPL